MDIFQYWDQEAVPDDVMVWINGFKIANPEFSHRLLDRAAAIAFIEAHYTPRERAAFELCGPPAMQADYLRLCLMYAVGGIYVDADQSPQERLSLLVDKADVGLMCKWYTPITNCPILINGVMILKNSGNLYVKACLELATELILGRRFNDILMSSGPGLLNAVWRAFDEGIDADLDVSMPENWQASGWDELMFLARQHIVPTPELRGDFHALTFISSDEFFNWFGLTNPRYKAGTRHWVNWHGSIYNTESS
jgi:hypothetical protein